MKANVERRASRSQPLRLLKGRVQESGPLLTIGKVAALSELSRDTLRYYEQERLLAPVKKSAAGYRLYSEDVLPRIRFIKHAQECGFALREIRELLALKVQNAACCRDVRALAVQKKLALETKIRSFQAMSDVLSELIRICNDTSKPTDACPILAALENTLTKPRKSRVRGGN